MSALDASGIVLAEVRQMPVLLEAVAHSLSAPPGPVTIGVGACLYWQWLHDQLEAQGHSIDARKLAELLRTNLQSYST